LNQVIGNLPSSVLWEADFDHTLVSLGGEMDSVQKVNYRSFQHPGNSQSLE
jgi:hypothetical protein